MSTTPEPSEFVELAFYGEIAPGHVPEEARRKLIAAIGIPADRVEAVFSGRRVVLKKSVPSGEAARYLAKLESIGILARSEPQRESAIPDGGAESPVRSDTPAALELVAEPPKPAIAPAAIEEVVCPKCGTKQPKRTLCVSCATDMPRFAAAQRTLKEEERAEKLAALKSASPPGSTPTNGPDIEYALEAPGLLGTGFDGRIGRIAYLVGGFALSAVLVFGVIAALKSGIWLMLLPLMLGAFFVSIRLTILRCHDLNWSGWWSLLMLVPYAGSLFNLVLLFVPGTRGGNDFGRPARPPGLPAVGISALVLVFAGLIGYAQVSRLMPMLAQYGIHGSQTPADSLAGLEDYDPRNNTVVMYSLTTCGYCEAKRRELNELGIRYTELFIDEDSAAGAQLDARLEQANFPRQTYGTPILEVNGIMLPNNPPMEDIVRHLRGARS